MSLSSSSKHNSFCSNYVPQPSQRSYCGRFWEKQLSSFGAGAIKGRLTESEFSQHVQAFRHLFPLVLPTPEAFDAAMELCERFSLSHWDGMIVGASRAAGASRLYTEDIGSPRTIDGIELVNPFV